MRTPPTRWIPLVLLAVVLACQAAEQTANPVLRGRRTRQTRHLPELEEVWDHDDAEASERAFRDLLDRAREAGDDDYRLQVLTQIARAQGLQRHFARAHATLDSVEGQLTDETPIARVRYLLERGRVHNTSGSPERALPLFAEAWDETRRLKLHGLAVDAVHMLALADAPRAIEWNTKALEYAESSGDPEALRWRGALYNNLGWAWHDAREFDRALKMFRRGFVFRVENKDEEGARIAKWCIARTLRSLGRNEEALDMQRDLALEFEQIGRVDGFVHEELGELLLALGQHDASKEQFGRAWDALSKDVAFVADHPARLERMRRLGAR